MDNNNPLSIIRRYFPLEFQIGQNPWDFYGISKGVLPDTDVIELPNYPAIRFIVKKIYEKKDLKSFYHQPIRAGDLNATGLITEIFRYLIYSYRITKNPTSFTNSINWLNEHISKQELDKILLAFADDFPPYVIQRKRKNIQDYLKSSTGEISNNEIIIKELILLYLSNNNPAFSPFLELFSDNAISRQTAYIDSLKSIEQFFRTQAGFGPKNKPLIDLLKEPIQASPYLLKGQLIYIKDNWASMLPDELLNRILTALDMIKEEEKLDFLAKGVSHVPDFKDKEFYPEYEAFTQDKDWMSKVVVIAKCTYVWLDQLSKKYGRHIHRLDQIPDEELNTLARWGFSGVWLIGVWERSPASQKIKQISGNPEALSSAYSIYDYTISNELGGEESLHNLQHRAGKRGIRIAADIVPNHTGIYSKWVIEHPDWFIQLDYPPFPSYSFNGPDLSWDERVGLYIEDGYWWRRDAAVVFKRLDKWTGGTKYIYHGNDGTSMPWNDTAQLNFLRADVREAVIQQILNIARKFQIIRLDAAMTLAKKHYQRLWFPHPGTGGGIPSRAERGMTQEEFDKLMPKEFWREVVDRINREMPDTLLLAEAFWLMEGYFVRTLGMHRVYNSAFMNMLKMEDNAKYRCVIKNILEFNPEIIRRFVNFINNPDEETAIAQFGNSDKYFGVCLMMVTMPGLPMFGHGQIEGFHEKYGMEYHRAYWDEQVDWNLVKRHEAEIFPLMRKRHLFSGVENFVLYDFFRPDGYVNENVFAYSNRCGSDRALIIYNNKYEHANGWVRTSTSISVPSDKPGERKLIQKTLAEGLGLNTDGRHYCIFRDHKTGLEFIRNGREIQDNGLYIDFGAFQYHVFIDFREVSDTHMGYYGRLCHILGGRGVPSIEDALKELIFGPVYAPFRKLLNKEILQAIAEKKDKQLFKERIDEILISIKQFINSNADEKAISSESLSALSGFFKLPDCGIEFITKRISDNPDYWRIPLLWLSVFNIGKLRTQKGYESQSESLMDELALIKLFSNEALLIKILAGSHNWYSASEKDCFKAIKDMFKNRDTQTFLNVNQYNGVLWFSKEKMEELMYWLLTVSAILVISRGKKILLEINSRLKTISKILQMSEKSGYKLEELAGLLSKA